MCGPAGSGKSTIARQMEADGMNRLSFDQTAWDQGHRSMPLPVDVHGAIDRRLRARLTDLVSAGEDVVLDFSFWSLEMRDDWRRLLAPFGIEPEIHYVSTPRNVVLERIRQRATRHPDDFQLDEVTAMAYFDDFEPPTTSEGHVIVVGAASNPSPPTR